MFTRLTEISYADGSEKGFAYVALHRIAWFKRVALRVNLHEWTCVSFGNSEESNICVKETPDEILTLIAEVENAP